MYMYVIYVYYIFMLYMCVIYVYMYVIYGWFRGSFWGLTYFVWRIFLIHTTSMILHQVLRTLRSALSDAACRRPVSFLRMMPHCIMASGFQPKERPANRPVPSTASQWGEYTIKKCKINYGKEAHQGTFDSNMRNVANSCFEFSNHSSLPSLLSGSQSSSTARQS